MAKRKERYHIYSDEGRRIGFVQGDTFYKSIVGSIHILYTPMSIANDVNALRSAEHYGATKVKITDVETGKVYTASIKHIFEKGLILDRGHSQQIALGLNHWKEKGVYQKQYNLDLKD